MKRKLWVMLITGTILFTLAACENNAADSITSETCVTGQAAGEISDGEKEHADFQIKRSKKKNVQVRVPDPKTAEGCVEVLLHDCGWSESLHDVDELENLWMDTSFLGEKGTAYITSYATGKVTNKEHDCLVLALGSGKKRGAPDDYAYLAVLDYYNKQSYLIETSIHAGFGADKVQLQDVTGDGLSEIILSGEPNTVICWQMYQLLDGNWKELYCNECICGNHKENLENEAFTFEMLDDYKARITSDAIDFNEVVNLLEAGYEKEDLEVNDKRETDDTWMRRVYEKGKYKKEQGEVEGVRFLRAEEYTEYRAEEYTEYRPVYNFFDQLDEKRRICLPLCVEVGREEIGRIYVYLKYDAEKEKIVLDQAKWEITKEKRVK